MSRLPAQTQAYQYPAPGQPGSGQPATAERPASGGISTGWLLAGLAVVGLGAWAWYTLGPDVRRYLKIRNM